ncbi:MAG: outer membrane beta-barrel protein [Bacteroidales bacterium]|nr:outer membrane beta-barrel protein [Bacteroidales bacterium]
MKEKFDHKLINKIREIFDSHQSDFNPQDWEMLKDRLPEKKSRLVPLLWTMAKAAAVILFVTVGSYMLWNGLVKNKTQIHDSELIVKTNQDSIENIVEKSDHISDPSDYILQEYEAEDLYSNKNSNKSSALSKGNSQQQTEQIAEIPITDTKKLTDLNITPATKSDSTHSSIPETKNIIADTRLQKNDTVIEPNNVIIQPDIAQLEIPPEVIENGPRQKQKVRFGVEFASFANYSPENITPDLNYGGGVTADIPIKKRFSFNPGLIVSVYNMEFSDKQNILDKTEQTFSNLENLIENNPEVKPTEINLTGLDIPINFQYQFIKRKSSNYFIELGFSSLLYLSENFSYSFATLSDTPNPSGVFEVEESTTKEIATSGSKTFDFAKLINFSVGWDYHLSKRLDLTINPYLKYPVSNLTSGNIKFGSGGLKLKLMLVLKK